MANEVAASPKPKRISKKVKAAIAALIAGDAKSVTRAAEIAGVSREHLSRELGRPHINELLRGKALRNVAMAAARASAVKVELLESSSEIVRDRASSFILSVNGITAESKPLDNIGAPPAGLTIIINHPPIAPAPPTIDVTPGALPRQPANKNMAS
jgi:transposase-like protein